MRRKAIQLAHKTLVISLPSKWVKRCEIKKGDELDVEEIKNTLKISISQKVKTNNKNVEAKDWERLLERYLISLYQKGVTEFEIRYNSADMFKKIQAASSQLVGFEIVEQAKGRLILKDITGPSEEKFKVVFRRLFLLVLDMMQEGISAMKTNNKKDIETVIVKDTEINKFSNFCLRKLNKGDVMDEEKARVYYFLCILLEKIADGFKEILNRKITKQQLTNLEEIIQLLRLCYDFTITPSQVKAFDISAQYDKIKSRNLMPELKSLTELIIPIQMQQLGFI